MQQKLMYMYIYVYTCTQNDLYTYNIHAHTAKCVHVNMCKLRQCALQHKIQCIRNVLGGLQVTTLYCFALGINICTVHSVYSLFTDRFLIHACMCVTERCLQYIQCT